MLLVSALCCLTLLGGCSSDHKSSQEPSPTNLDSLQEDAEQTATGEQNGSTNGSLGVFSMQDLAGKSYTQEMFADYDLTMVNIFTTWCSPCINEIPDLQKLSESMKDQNVQVVGIILDSLDRFGKEDQEALEKAKLIAERTGASYPFLIPDQN